MMIQQMGLQAKTFFMISATVLIISLITLTMIVLYSARELKEESYSKIREIAYMHSYEIEKEFGDKMAMARAYAVSIQTILDSDSDDKQLAIMKNTELFLDYLPANSAVWAMFEPGLTVSRKFTPYISIKEGVPVKSVSGLWEKRYAEYYKKTRNAGRETVSVVYRETDTSPFITSFCVPVIYHGRITGVVGIDLALSDLSTRMGKVKPLDDKSFAFMVSNEGIFVAHPWPVYFGHNISDPKFKTAPETFQAIKLGKEVREIRKSPLTGLQWYVYFVPVKIGSSNAPWSFGITVPLDVVLKKTNNLIIASIINGVLSTIVLIAALFFIIRIISGPVQNTLVNMNMAIKQASEAICFIGLDRKIQFVNPAVEKLSGIPAASMIGSDPYLKNKAGLKPEEIWQTLNRGNIWTGCIIFKSNDTSQNSIEVTITPVRDDRGLLHGYLEIGRDITHELHMESQLRQSQKMEAIGTLAGGIAHDFNNILGAVFGYAELAILAEEDRAKSTQYIQGILNMATRARELVNQVLTFSRKTEQEFTPVNTADILNDVMKLIRASLPSTIEIRQAINSTSFIMGDTTQFHQIIMNLCTNSAHAMYDKGGILDVSLDDVDADEHFASLYPDMRPGKYIRLKISDTGKGIPPENIERIFEPFFTTKVQGSGTGLGLAVVHGIVKSFGGTITVYSEILKGTEFTIYFPALSDYDKNKPESSLPSLNRGTESILLVDDEQSLVEIEQIMLENLGYRVQGFTDSNLALDAFRNDPSAFDIVLTDYTMPKLNGIELAVKMTEIRPDIPVFLFSGFFDKETEYRAKKAGITALISKPVTSHDLVHTIQTRLNRNTV